MHTYLFKYNDKLVIIETYSIYQHVECRYMLSIHNAMKHPQTILSSLTTDISMIGHVILCCGDVCIR